MSEIPEPTEEKEAHSPSEIVAKEVSASLVKAGLLHPTRAAGFVKALGQGRIKIEDLRFDIEKSDS
jgi:hypothetical protein